MRPRRRGGGDGGESARRRPSASRAQEWRAARTSTPTARSRGRWRADWVACCLSDGRAPVARYHARGCDCEPLRRASCLLCGSFLSFHIRFGPVRSTTHERCEAQRREAAESGRAEPRKRSVRLTREVARPRVSLYSPPPPAHLASAAFPLATCRSKWRHGAAREGCAHNVLAPARAALTNHCPRDDCTRLLFFARILQIFIVDRRATKPSHSKGLRRLRDRPPPRPAPPAPPPAPLLTSTSIAFRIPFLSSRTAVNMSTTAPRSRAEASSAERSSRCTTTLSPPPSGRMKPKSPLKRKNVPV